MDETELMNLINRLNSGLSLTTDELRRLSQATGMSSQRLTQFSNDLRAQGRAANQQLTSFAVNLGSASKSVGSFETGLDAVISTMSGLASIVPVVGTQLSGSIQLLGNLIKGTASAFTDLANVGALTADGMKGIQDQFIKSGMTLDGFKAVVTANSATLAKFGGTVGQGADQFSSIVGRIAMDYDGVGMDLRRLGIMTDAIGESTAAFVEQQTRLGLSQRKSSAALTQGAVQFTKEMDLLQKVTGMTRREIQAQQDAALSEARFRATIDEMVTNNQEGASKALLDFQTQLGRVSPQLAQAFRDSVTGYLSSPAARMGFVVTNGAMQDIAERLKSGGITTQDALTELQASVKDNIPFLRDQAQAIGNQNEILGEYANLSDFANAKIKDGLVLAEKTQRQQVSGQDELTNNTVVAAQEFEKFSRALSIFGFAVMPYTVKVVEKFASVMNDAIGIIGKVLGFDLPGFTESGRPGETAAPTGPAGTPRPTVTTPQLQQAAKDVGAAKERQQQAETQRIDTLKDISAVENEIKILQDQQRRGQNVKAQLEAAEKRLAELKQQNVRNAEEQLAADRAKKDADQRATEESQRRARMMIRQRELEYEIQRNTESIRDFTKRKEESERELAKPGIGGFRAAQLRDTIRITNNQILDAENQLKKHTEELANVRRELVKTEAPLPVLNNQLDRTLSTAIMIAESGMRNIESEVKDAAGKKTLSRTYGLGQFTKSTAESVIASAPESSPLRGKTFEEFRRDPKLQEEAVKLLIASKQAELKAMGLKGTDVETYMSYFLGSEGFKKLAPHRGTDTPLSQVMSPEALEANREMLNPRGRAAIRTVADLEFEMQRRLNRAYAEIDKVKKEKEKQNTSAPDKVSQASPLTADVAMMAQGGIVGQRTNTVLGERGPEAVIPLSGGRFVPVKMDNTFKTFASDVRTIVEQLQVEGPTTAGGLKEVIANLALEVNKLNTRTMSTDSAPVLASLMEQMVNLQRDSNSTNSRILQMARG